MREAPWRRWLSGQWFLIRLGGILLTGVAATVTRRSAAGARRQWRAVAALCLALAFSAVTAVLRLIDTQPAEIEVQQLDDASLGVFLGSDSTVALAPKPTVGWVELGGEAPRPVWSLRIDIGEPNSAILTMALLDAPDLWRLDLINPVDVFVQLPRGATLSDDGGDLIAGSAGDACASWSNGATTAYARPQTQQSRGGATVVHCPIPAAGKLSQLLFQIGFEWTDRTKSDIGLGRHESWIRVLERFEQASGLDLPGSAYTALGQPLEVSLGMPPSERIVDAFPSPDGGGLSERVWRLERGGDIQYTVERPRDRTVIAPAIDISLLLAGVFFGLVPAAWRRPAPKG